MSAPPIRILLWYWGRKGGGPRHALDLARTLKQREDVEVHLALSRQCDLIEAFRALDVPTLEIDTYTDIASCLRATLLLPVTMARLARYVRKHRIDLVLSTMTHLWTRPTLPLLNGTGVPVVCTIHDATPHPGDGAPLKDWFYRPPPGLAGYVAPTRFVADRLVDVHGVAPDSVAVAPLGPPLDWQGRRTRGTDTTGQPLSLLFLGRILPYKGLDRLVRAYGALRERSLPVRLRVSGGGDLGNQAAALSALPDVTIDNRWIPDEEIPALLSAADILVLPYIEASQSGLVNEAFATGLPVVATPVGGLAEQVRDGDNGLLAADTSAESVTAALARLVDDRSLLQQLSEGALRTTALNETWLEAADAIVTLARRVKRN